MSTAGDAEAKRTVQWALRLLQTITNTGTADVLQQQLGKMFRLRVSLPFVPAKAVQDEPRLADLLGKATMLAMREVAVHCNLNSSNQALMEAMNLLFEALLTVLRRLADLDGGSEASQRSFASFLDSIGFIPVLAATATAMSNAVEHGRRRSAHIAALSAIPLFSSCWLLFDTWPRNNTILSGSSISQTIAPLSRLALNYKRFCSKANNSLVRLGAKDSVADHDVSPACHLADMFKMVLVVELLHSTASITPERAKAIAPALASGDLLLLMLAYLACFAQVLHEKQNGVSKASVAGALRNRGLGAQHKQGLKIPASHRQVLGMVGLDANVTTMRENVFSLLPQNGADRTTLANGSDDVQSVALALMSLIQVIYMIARIMHMAVSNPEPSPAAASAAAASSIIPLCFSDGWSAGKEISSRRTSLPRLQATAPAVANLLANPGDLVEGLTLLLLELPLLAPDSNLVKGCLELAELLVGLLDASKPIAADAVYMRMAQPMLHQLGPVVLYACRDLEEPANMDVLKHLCMVCHLMEFCYKHDEGLAQVKAAYRDSPLSCCAVMEAALRVTALAPETGQPRIPAAAVNFAHACSWLCDPCTVDARQDTGQVSHQQQVALQQFALLVTALKVSAGRLQSAPELRWTALQAAGKIAHVAACQAGRLLTGQHGEASQAMNRETLTLWLVLLARSCRQIADTLTAQHQNSKPIIISLTSSLRARRFSSGLLSPQGLLQRCIEALGAMHKILLLLEYLPGYKAGTAAAGQHEHQQLLQSIDSLRQTLQLDLTEQADGWPPDSQQYDAEWDQFTSTIKPDSLVQLTQIVDQVVTLSPTRHCCNNPSCSSTASLSELKLAHRV